MNTKRIREIANEAGLLVHNPNGVPTKLEKFAELIAADERNRIWTQSHWTEYERKIVAAEREACAKVCEEHPSGLNMLGGAFVTCAAAIRARGNE